MTRLLMAVEVLWICLFDQGARRWLFGSVRSGYLDSWFDNPRTWWCRATGHRGVVFYNPGGLEPDMTCNGCGDDLG